MGEDLITYFESVFWGTIGWSVMVARTFFDYSNQVESTPRGKFRFKAFKEKYDQYWVFGFVGMLALSAISDLIWEEALSKMIFGVETPYDIRLNVIIGIVSIPLIRRIAPKKV